MSRHSQSSQPTQPTQPSQPRVFTQPRLKNGDGDRAICSICQKEYERDPLLVQDADLCPECRKTFGGMAYVFCRKCNSVVTRVKPGLTQCGYMVLPGQLLHISACPTCTPGTAMAVPEEMTGFLKEKGLMDRQGKLKSQEI